jgi:hypothetical protein
MNDEGLIADATTANPFRVPYRHVDISKFYPHGDVSFP